MAIDYGDESEILWQKIEGTLRAFNNHRQVRDILADPGEQDITAAVNFTKIREAGERAGLKSDPIISQASLLTGLAQNVLRDHSDAKSIREFQTLTHPEHLGRIFKVLIQRR
jgi:SAM-dependent MidA family methyltransferase